MKYNYYLLKYSSVTSKYPINPILMGLKFLYPQKNEFPFKTRNQDIAKFTNINSEPAGKLNVLLPDNIYATISIQSTDMISLRRKPLCNRENRRKLIQSIQIYKPIIIKSFQVISLNMAILGIRTI